MKKLFNFLFISVLCFAVNNTVFAQPNSVELQDGGGSLLSSHSSIEEAYNAIPAVFTQAYIIEILAAYTGANEVFPIDLTSKSGHSAVNTITIRPDAGNSGEVITSANTSGTINIHRTDYLIIDGRPGGVGTVPDLEIRNTSTGSNAFAVLLDSGATFCVIKYIKSYANSNGTTGGRNIEIGPSPNIPGGTSNNIVDNCYVNGGRTAIGIDGGTAPSGNPAVNNIISNCTIENFGFNAIWLLNLAGSTDVVDNVINGTGTHSGIANVTAISIQSSFDGYITNINRNKITNFIALSTATSLAPRGIATITAPGTGSVLNIENNFIAMTADNNNAATTYGIYTTGTTESYTCNIYYNTILIGGNQTGGLAGRIVSAGIVKQSTVAGVVYNQRNNICINTRTGGTAGVIHAGVGINADAGTLDIDYNCYYSATGIPASWDSLNYATLQDYQNAIGDYENNSRVKNVTFISSSDLHLDGSSIQDPDLSARPITGIITDIDGDTRSAGFPYKGADESTAFSLKTLNLTVNLEACSPVQDTVVVSLRSSSSPYGLIEMSKVYLSNTGTAAVNFAKAVDGINYYVVVNHRNSIETWSKAGGEVFAAGVLNFDFTTAASQAFGNNMVNVSSEWSNYTGDVNQEGVVDVGDLSIIDNDAFGFVSGYVASDLNCDNVVDLTDASFADNNAANFVSVVKP
ncbi:MAG TPA: hypothetical protein PK536_12590 [Ignavibacteria bacterium]|nr:hypothetical protein [Bacteroidota bacterium]HRI86275.1 hypothetical protein [Ignavibacteria bacterium]HRJ99725.1 hypothetical protein [Ignavibacteria bacterium]